MRKAAEGRIFCVFNCTVRASKHIVSFLEETECGPVLVVTEAETEYGVRGALMSSHNAEEEVPETSSKQMELPGRTQKSGPSKRRSCCKLLPGKVNLTA